MNSRKVSPKKERPGTATSRAVSLRISTDHYQRAQSLAKRKGVTVAAIIQIGLAEKLERAERNES